MRKTRKCLQQLGSNGNEAEEHGGRAEAGGAGTAAVASLAAGAVKTVLVVGRLVVKTSLAVDLALDDLALEAVEVLANIGEVGSGLDVDGALDVVELGESSAIDG